MSNEGTAFPGARLSRGSGRGLGTPRKMAVSSPVGLNKNFRADCRLDKVCLFSDP